MKSSCRWLLFLFALGFGALGPTLLRAQAPQQNKKQVRLPVEIVVTVGEKMAEKLAVSGDGMTVLSVEDGALKIWNAATGILLRTIETDRADPVSAIAVSFDGTRLLSGGGYDLLDDRDERVSLWNAATGQLVRSFDGHTRHIAAVAFSYDGKRVLSGSDDKTVNLWDADSGRLLRTFQASAGIRDVAFSPDGTRVLAAAENKVFLWDAATGSLLRNFDGHAKTMLSVAFSPDGARIATGGFDETAKLWDVATGRLLRTFEITSPPVDKIAFSLDGSRILSAETGHAKLWDAATGNLLKTFDCDGGRIAFMPDGASLLSWSNRFEFRDLMTADLIRSFGKDGLPGVTSAAFSFDGRRGVFGGAELKLWNLVTATPVRGFEGYSGKIRSAVFSPNDTQILSGSDDGTISLWDVGSGKSIRTFLPTFSADSVALSSDGRRVLAQATAKVQSWEYFAAPRYRTVVKIWDLATGRLIQDFESPETNDGGTAVFSPGKDRLLFGEESLTLWDMATNKSVQTFDLNGTVFTSHRIAFSPDAKYLLWAGLGKQGNKSSATVGKNPTLRLLRAADGERLYTFAGHSDFVSSLAFSPNGKWAVSASSDRTAKVWDLTTGKLLHSLNGHRAAVRSAAFSPDGKRILSASDDGTIKLWDAVKGELLATFIGKGGDWIAFTPEGFFDASNGGEKLVSFVRGLDVLGPDRVSKVLHRPDLLQAKTSGHPDGKLKAAVGQIVIE